MSATVFSARGLGKRYEIRPQTSLLLALTRRSKPISTWALRDVDVDVDAGEVVAVVGRNGAGKSTLMKLAAGVTAPTEGTVERPRRIAPLIEVGAGFNADLTGRENVEVNARLLGLGAREVAAVFDDVVAFAELENVIDQPVRQYSSGMFMRLGFSVAIHTRPELLIVDEVLAVGDLPFQARCLERIRALRTEGAGILFVSHNLTAVLNLADRALLLERGEPVCTGSPQDVIGAYHDLLAQPSVDPAIGDDIGVSGDLRIDDVRVLAPDGTEPSLWQPGQRARLSIDVRAEADTPEGLVGLRIVGEGTGVVASWRADDGPFVPPLRAGERATFEIDLDLNLVEGGYGVDIAVAKRDWTELLVHRDGVARIGVAARVGASGVADLAPALAVRTA